MSAEAKRFWDEWFDTSTLPADLKRKLSSYDLKCLSQRTHTILLGMAEDIERKAN